MPEDLRPGFDLIWDILSGGFGDLPTMPTDTPNPLGDLFSGFFDGDGPGGLDPNIPTDAHLLFYIIEAFFGGLHDFPGSTPPDSGPAGSLEEALARLFGGYGDGPGSTPPDSGPGTTFEDFLASLFNGVGDGPGEPPSTPRPGFSLEDVLDFGHPYRGAGAVQTTPLQDEAKAEPEWDGNVPPDFTDGFDFFM